MPTKARRTVFQYIQTIRDNVMVDFFQSKQITTLQKLCDNSHLEAEIIASQKKIVIVIPCSIHHYQMRTIHNLLNQLNSVPFIYQIIIILNGKVANQTNHELLDIDDPRVTLINALSSDRAGKGYALKIGFDFAYSQHQEHSVIVTLDADLQSFTTEYLLKLIYPIAVLNGHFNKGYYARFSDNKLDGRLTRLLVFPLLYAMQLQHPKDQLLEWLLEFRYPLSGDVSFSSELIPELNITEHWSYDLSLLISVFQKKEKIDIYQTELSDNYQHLHQPIEKNESEGLLRVAENILDYLTTLYALDKTRLISDYNLLAKQYCKKYQKLASFNGLNYAQKKEEDLITAIVTYLQRTKYSQQT